MLFRLPLITTAWVFLFLFHLGLSTAKSVVVISEFLADNVDGLVDEDGDHSDWIEVTNMGSAAENLSGWRLTDTRSSPSKWIFPAGVRLPAAGRLIVFASGKNRSRAGSPLHANFSLRKEGEYLALFPPGASIPTTAFAPVFPPQRADVSYGTGFRTSGPSSVGDGSPARIRIPSASDTGPGWRGAFQTEPFDDSGWIQGGVRVGYDDLTEVAAGQLLGYWSFDDASVPGIVQDISGRQNHGTLIGPAVVTGPLGGRSGRPGDRALDLGSGNNGASVRVDTAATGAFDALQQLDKVTLSLWCFGGPQLPAMNSVFWFDTGAGVGDGRNIMAHLPWSDSVIYFDTSGCCEGDTRISRQETDASRWQGRWNHYVFLKNGPRKEIWQNGVLWHSGSGAAPLKAIRSLWLGSAPGGVVSYAGKLDDFAVWAGALLPEDIRLLAAGGSPAFIGSYRPFIVTDLTRPMRGISSTAWMRVPFELPPSFSSDILRLKLRYDDGIAVWLNGAEVARRNSPVAQGRSKADALQPVEMDLDATGGRAHEGTNILALEALNLKPDDSDFLVTIELTQGQSLPGRYFPIPTPLEANGEGVAAFVSDTAFSPPRGFYDVPIQVTLSTVTPGARIIYTRDGSLPTPSHGVVVLPQNSGVPPSVTLNVSGTQAIRAFAMHEDQEPSKVQTHTYLFAAQVASQSASPSGFPTTWGVYGAYGPFPGQPVPADYAMDARATTVAAAGVPLREAILSLPAVCLTTDVTNLFDPVTGIYPNSAAQGAQWVRPASVEMILPEGMPGFQIDAGLRIHGGLSRQHWHARKHSFRVNFERDFGPPRLHHRLFNDTRVTSFNELTLRASSTDSWAVEDSHPWTRPKATYLRDPWMKDTQQAMGWPCGHSRYVHVFLNGLYWGQYNLAERTESAWMAENEGGAPEDYDILKDFGEVESGSKAIWDEMIALASGGLGTDEAYWRIQGRGPGGTRDTALALYLDVDSLIDYMILHIYAGAIDWPNHNWWSARRKGEFSKGFQFFTWDQEISNISTAEVNTYTGENFASVSGPKDSPAFLYRQLRDSPRFRERFSSRVIALTTGVGILTPPQNAARWERRQAEIDKSIVAESARWGDSRQSSLLKRSDWLAEMNWMRLTYWPQIHPIALARFQSVALYSTSAAPAVLMSPAGGIVNPGTRVRLSGGAQIYYTTNGTDPIQPSGALAPGARAYTNTLPVTGAVEIRAQRLVGGKPTSTARGFFLLTSNVAPPYSVVVSELNYHPETNEEEEFLEVWNVSSRQYAVLGGARISGAVDGACVTGWILPPAGRALLVRNRAVFEARYGAGLPIAGEYAGQLSNQGEWIHALAPSGFQLSSFRYGTLPPWPGSADGGGRSLTLKQGGDGGDPATPLKWRPSIAVGGTPGSDDSIAFTGDPLADVDRDGLTSLSEYFIGSSDADATSGPDRTPSLSLSPEGSLSFSLIHSLGADRAAYEWDYSPDLQNWNVAEGWDVPKSVVEGGSERLTWTVPSQGAPTSFYRLRVMLR